MYGFLVVVVFMRDFLAATQDRSLVNAIFVCVTVTLHGKSTISRKWCDNFCLNWVKSFIYIIPILCIDLVWIE